MRQKEAFKTQYEFHLGPKKEPRKVCLAFQHLSLYLGCSIFPKGYKYMHMYVIRCESQCLGFGFSSYWGSDKFIASKTKVVVMADLS